jgi:hypothetical protein
MNPHLLTATTTLLNKIVKSRHQAHARAVKVAKINTPLAKKITELNEIES